MVSRPGENLLSVCVGVGVGVTDGDGVGEADDEGMLVAVLLGLFLTDV